MKTQRSAGETKGSLKDFLLIRSSGDVDRDVERGLVGFFIVLRITDLLSASFVFGNGLSMTTDRAVYVVLSVAMVGFCTWMCLASWRRGGLVLSPWGIADTVVAVGFLIGLAAIFPASAQIGTWEVWAPGYAFGTAVGIGVWASSIRRALGLSSLVGGAYIVSMLVWSDRQIWTVLGNALQYPFAALVLTWIAGYMRMLARETKKARAEALEAQRATERERYRLAVHDATSVLHLLGDDETPDVMRKALRKQAVAESAKLRSYLTDDAPVAAQAATLSGLVRAVAGSFQDLPIELAIDLVRDISLPPEQFAAIDGALTTVLHNVRRHAGASMVVIHADHRNEQWEISVWDDGAGFEASEESFGFGLRHQVVGALSEHAIDARIESAIGVGTSVTMSGVILQTPAFDPAKTRVQN